MTRRRPERSDDIASDTDEHALTDLLADLAATLRATEELPVSPSTSVWLGEAHAIAEDLTHDTPDPEVVHERVGHVRHLLTNAGDPGNEAAADHVADARELTETILSHLDDPHADGGES